MTLDDTPSLNTRLRAVMSLCGLLLAAACASSGDDKARVTGQSAADVNWAFADIAAMEQKVAALETENATLKREVVSLGRKLEQAQEAAALAVAEAASAPAVIAQSTFTPPTPRPSAAPVISAPDPGNDLTAAKVETETAPKLVQPTFASAETSFENEAVDPQLALSSILWGVHLDSYSRQRFAREGWRRLQRNFPDELGLLEPRTEKVAIEGRGDVYRLIGGGFASEDTAKALCHELSTKNQYCRVVTFDGERLSLAETG